MKLGRLSVSWRHICEQCRPLEIALANCNAKLQQSDVEVAQLRVKCADLQQSAQAVKRDQADTKHAHAELARITQELCSMTRQQSAGAAMAVVLAWSLWEQRGPQLARENALLREQLRSVALAGMRQTNPMMGAPLCDAPVPTGKEN